MQANADHLSRLEAEYKKLWRQRQFFGAIVRLSKIWWWTEGSPQAAGSPQTPALLSQPIPPEALETAKEQARGMLRKLERMLELGDTYTFEEAVVMVTLRVDLWLAQSYLLAIHTIGLELSTEAADDQIRDLLLDPAVRRLVDSAEEEVQRQGGVTLRDCGLLG
jgi:hypothetical protein